MDNNIGNDNNFFMNDGDYADYHYCSTPERNTDDEFDDEVEINLDSKLLITDLRRTSGGYIVNSSAYISDDNWNTLVVSDKNAKRILCAICDLYINIENCARHVDTAGHKTNLTTNVPLKRFELSITRKIAHGYHCGVCNVIFEDIDNHYDTKNHSEKMLSAINKANDILYDNDNHTIPNTMKLPDSNPRYGNRYYNNVNFGNDNNNFGNENVNFGNENDNFGNDNDNFGNGNDNFGNKNNDFAPANDDNMNCNIETVWEPTISYAEMAKLKEKVPKELKIDLGDKIVTVKYDCWNMIVYTSGSSFYCMACQVTGIRRVKIEHCTSGAHLARLRKCSVVKAYETHLIRRVGDKLYHCGHCNNLQPINEMVIHVEQKHPKSNFKLDKDKMEYEHNIEIAQIKGISFDNHSHVSNGNRPDKSEPRPILKTMSTPIKEKSPKSVQFNNVPTINLVPVENVSPNLVPNENSKPKHVPTENQAQIHTEFMLDNTDDVQAKLVPTKNGCETGKIQHVSTENDTPIFSFVPFNVPPPNYEDNQNGFIDSIKKSDKPRLFNDSIILTSQFGFQIYVYVEAFNTIVKAKNGLMCLVCDMSLTDASGHIVEDLHVEMLQRVNFIPEFTCNLVRMLRNKLHCVICNITTDNDRSAILSHIATYEHGLLLRKALFLSDVPNNFEEPGFGVCKDIEPELHRNRKSYFSLNVEVVGDADLLARHVIARWPGSMENLYHCAFCNVIVSRKYLEQHLKWAPHKYHAEIALSHDRRAREVERVMGIPEIEATPIPEKYNGLTDCTKNIILYNVKILKKRTVNNDKFNERQSKMVIFNANVYKIDFDHWNGFVTVKDKFRCIICNVVFKKSAFESHYLSKVHSENLGRPFYRVEAYGLVRELSDNRLHCLICNIELSNADNISEHASGKKHTKNVEIVESEASGPDGYDECDDDPYIV